MSEKINDLLTACILQIKYRPGRVFDLKLSYRAAHNTQSSADQNLLVSDEIMLAFGHHVWRTFFKVHHFTVRKNKNLP